MKSVPALLSSLLDASDAASRRILNYLNNCSALPVGERVHHLSVFPIRTCATSFREELCMGPSLRGQIPSVSLSTGVDSLSALSDSVAPGKRRTTATFHSA